MARPPRDKTRPRARPAPTRVGSCPLLAPPCLEREKRSNEGRPIDASRNLSHRPVLWQREAGAKESLRRWEAPRSSTSRSTRHHPRTHGGEGMRLGGGSSAPAADEAEEGRERERRTERERTSYGEGKREMMGVGSQMTRWVKLASARFRSGSAASVSQSPLACLF